MKSFFYPRLAFTNLKKNAKLYFPYLLTSSFTVMMFYLINYLSSHDGIDQMSTGSRTMQVIFSSYIMELRQSVPRCRFIIGYCRLKN